VRKYLLILITALAMSGMTAGAFCYTADVFDISGNTYFPEVKEEFSRAEKSIKVMFAMESSLSRQDSKPNQLIDELIRARERGVEVEVILDQNVDFVRGMHSSLYLSGK
jgi:phosphatidylserine/phosphatidylglycerophosphate/cardiolipin synthase-like enzyme